MNIATIIAGVKSVAFVAAAAAVIFAPHAHAQPQHVDEDSTAFDCRTDGNQICGPGNTQGVPAGDYNHR